jgi:hypothetical protein
MTIYIRTKMTSGGKIAEKSPPKLNTLGNNGTSGVGGENRTRR